MNDYSLVLHYRPGYPVLLESQTAARLRTRAAAHSRRQWLSVAGVVTLLPITAFASGDSLSARVRECAAETDSLLRLTCYDKRVAPFASQRRRERQRQSPTTARLRARRGAEPKPNAVSEYRATRSICPKIAARAAHVVGINGEHEDRRWCTSITARSGRQVREPAEELNLSAGDSVTIDKRSLLGTYWLSSRTGGVMKVRLKE